MKITIEHYDSIVTIEENFETMHELLDIYKRLALAITFSENLWREAILDTADDLRTSEMRIDD